jgi:hypothetical protein
VVRHRYRFIDFSIVTAITALVFYAGLKFDIFANAPNHTPAADTLEFDELLATIIILFLGLLWAIRRMLRERRETTRRAAVEREMRILAFHDPLTDLPNRRQFDDALKAAVFAPLNQQRATGGFPSTGALSSALNASVAPKSKAAYAVNISSTVATMFSAAGVNCWLRAVHSHLSRRTPFRVHRGFCPRTQLRRAFLS